MTVTLNQIDAVIVGRLRNFLTMAGLSTVTTGNADLLDPIANAVFELGGTVATYTAVADSDLLTVDSSDPRQLFDVVELKTLEHIATNLDQVTLTADGSTYALNDLAARVDRAIQRKQEYMRATYGYGGGVLTAGTISLGFQASNPPV